MKKMVREQLFVLRLSRYPIFDQLQLEEALFRIDKRNWFLWNEGTTEPTIVLGISGKPREMLNMEYVKQCPIPLIQRFSGGGTVVVDHQTIFSSFLFNQQALPQIKPYPKEIMAWTGEFYAPVFAALEGTNFAVREDDYVFGDYKIGGNAQSISKDRWIHHTSFLYDYELRNMRYLQLPKKQPQYRSQRSHSHFLTTLESNGIDPDTLYQRILDALQVSFEVSEVDLEDITPLVQSPHRQTTKYLEV